MTKYDYKSLKNIDQKLENIITKLNLEDTPPVVDFLISKSKFYFATPVYKNQKVIFKARIADHRVLKKSGKQFQIERRFIHNLQKYYSREPLVSRIPRCLASQHKDFEWMISEFIDGQTIGQNMLSFENPDKQTINEIINLLLDIQSFPMTEFIQKHKWTSAMRRSNYERYERSYYKFTKNYTSILSKFLSAKDLKKAKEILLSHSDLIDDSCTILAHGDFQPTNIFISHDQAVAIDWESLCLGNSAIDIATLWQRMTSDPTLRQYFLQESSKSSVQKDNFPQLFQTNILITLMGEFAIWQSELENDNPDTQKLARQSLELCYNNYMQALNGEKIENYE